MTVIQGIAATKWRIIKSHITDRNTGTIPPQTINTPHDLPMSATYLWKCNSNVNVELLNKERDTNNSRYLEWYNVSLKHFSVLLF